MQPLAGYGCVWHDMLPHGQVQNICNIMLARRGSPSIAFCSAGTAPEACKPWLFLHVLWDICELC